MKARNPFGAASTAWIPLLLACVLGVVVSTAQAANQPPETFVKAIVDDVLGVIRQNPDRKTLRKVAEQKVLPHFDFQQMTRLAVGAAWRKASPEQQSALEHNFRTLLVNTYTNALSQGASSDAAVDYKPGATKDNDATVHTVVKQSGKPPLPIDYRLQVREGEWKVYDVVVEGVSLVTNYRSSFSEEVSKSGIDGLIHKLEQRNNSPAKG